MKWFSLRPGDFLDDAWRFNGVGGLRLSKLSVSLSSINMEEDRLPDASSCEPTDHCELEVLRSGGSVSGTKASVPMPGSSSSSSSSSSSGSCTACGMGQRPCFSLSSALKTGLAIR